MPVATYNALVTQVAALTAQVDTTDAATLIKEARTAGRGGGGRRGVPDRLRRPEGVAALKALLDPRPAIAALTASQTAAVTLPEKIRAGRALGRRQVRRRPARHQPRGLCQGQGLSKPVSREGSSV